MTSDAGEHETNWDLLEWLAQSHGLGDTTKQVKLHGAAKLGAKKAMGVLNAVSRLTITPKTRHRRTNMIQSLLDAGADPWAGEVTDGVLVLRATRSSAAFARIITHPSFPGWRAVALDPYFRSMVRDLDRAQISDLLDHGMPPDMAVGQHASDRLVDVCIHPHAVDELVRRGARITVNLLEQIAAAKMWAGPAIMGLAMRRHGTADGEAIASAVLKGGLKANHSGQIKVGVVLCGAKATVTIAGTDNNNARDNGLSAIASAASRNAIDLDDKALGQVCQILQSMATDVDMAKLRGKIGMAWLGSAIEDLATRVASGHAALDTPATLALAGLVSGIVPAPWRVQWLQDTGPMDRCEQILSRCRGNPVDAMSKSMVYHWSSAINKHFPGQAPVSFFKPAPRNFNTWLARDIEKWLKWAAFAADHVKAGGAIADPAFLDTLDELADNIKTNPSFSSMVHDVTGHANFIRSNMSQEQMQSATPELASATRPSPRM